MVEEIRAQQVNRARPVTGKGFALGVASVVLRLALAQIVCNLLIAATGMGLLNVLFYLYAVMTLALFMRRTVASSAYTLKQETLVLERKLGDRAQEAAYGSQLRKRFPDSDEARLLRLGQYE